MTRTGREPARLRQLDQTVAFPRPDLSSDLIGDSCWLLAVHDETDHTRRPPRIPPSRNNRHEGIIKKQHRRAHDLAAMTATLFPNPGAIDFEAVEPETMQRQRRALRFKLSAGPEHGAPLSCMLAVTDMAKVARILDRESGLELTGPRELPLMSQCARQSVGGSKKARWRDATAR